LKKSACDGEPVATLMPPTLAETPATLLPPNTRLASIHR
jgi:hypothetical protein